jgi:hypothetical protein
VPFYTSYVLPPTPSSHSLTLFLVPGISLGYELISRCRFIWLTILVGENDDVQSNYWRIIVGVLCIGTVSGAVAQSVLLERFWKKSVYFLPRTVGSPAHIMSSIRHHLLGTAFAVTILIMVSLPLFVSFPYLKLYRLFSPLLPPPSLAPTCSGPMRAAFWCLLSGSSASFRIEPHIIHSFAGLPSFAI